MSTPLPRLGTFLLYAGVFLPLFIRSPQNRRPVAPMLPGEVAACVAFSLDIAHLPASFPLDLSVFVVILPRPPCRLIPSYF